MEKNCSFTEYVANKFDNAFWAVAETYLRENFDSMDIELYKIHRAGEPEISDVKVEHVWIDDLPGMSIKFDVALSMTFEIPEADYHYDNYEEKTKWLMAQCQGDLDKRLEDFEILSVSAYNGKGRAKNPMDDALVPVINKNNLDAVAEDFLRRNYPKALLEPVGVDPYELAKGMGLDVRMERITKDGTIFGRSFFYDCETELYDPKTDRMVYETIPAGTILVDKEVWFLSVTGATNNTIVHECVHWDKHKKAFALARLYDKELSNIGCKVVGGIAGNTRDAVDWMEWQANALAPRIQMPITVFKKRVDALISKFRREMKAFDMIEIIQPIIDQIVLDFGVSRTAAKIRLIDVGYEEAMGAFIYIDGHYVRPHKSMKGYLSRNKTFSISATDAAIQTFFNPEFKNAKESGRYQYIDSHYVLNHPLFIEMGEDGNLQLTHYALNHMDECCLAFELSVKSHCGEKYHSECFLNRDRHSTVDFEVAFHDGYENSPPERRLKLLQETIAEENHVYESLPNGYTAALKIVIDWRNEQRKNELKEHPQKQIDKITAVEIANRTGLNEATVRRTLNDGDSSTNTLVLICLALHLPYKISKHIMDHSPYPLKLNNTDHQWYDFVLQHHYAKTVEEVKSMLISYGVTPL